MRVINTTDHFEVLGRWRCRDFQASQNAGGGGTPEEET